MKILTLFNQEHTEKLTGAHKRYLRLLRYLVGRGHEVRLISPTNPLPDKNKLKHYPADPPEVESNLIPNSWLWRFRVNRKLKNISEIDELASADVILAFGNNAPAASLVSNILDIKLILAIRSSPMKYLKNRLEKRGLQITENFSVRLNWLNILYLPIARFYYARFYKRASRIIVQSDYHKQELLKEFSKLKKDQIKMLPNDVPKIETNSLRKPSVWENIETQKNIVFVGSLVPRKGTKVLIKAFTNLIERGYDFGLIVIGDGPEREKLRKFAMEQDVFNRMTFTGYVENPVSHIKQADLTVVPSLRDAFPNVMLESLSVGRPVIASRVGAIPEVLEKEKYLFEPGNSRELTKKIEHLLTTNMSSVIENDIQNIVKKYSFNWEEEFEKKITKVE